LCRAPEPGDAATAPGAGGEALRQASLTRAPADSPGLFTSVRSARRAGRRRGRGSAPRPRRHPPRRTGALVNSLRYEPVGEGARRPRATACPRIFRSERGLGPRNRILGGGSEGGRSPPPSVLGAVLVKELQAGLVEGGGLLDEVHVTGVG